MTRDPARLRRELVFKKTFKGFLKTDTDYSSEGFLKTNIDHSSAYVYKPLFTFVNVIEGDLPKSPKIGENVSFNSLISMLANGNSITILPHDEDYF